MRQFVLLFLLLAYCHVSFAQTTLQAHAGVDTVFCGFQESPAIYTLGATEPASGGVQPYVYAWDISPKPFINELDITLFASDLIPDTTAANPTLYLSLLNNAHITFVLTVTDAASNVAIDSMVIKKSDWIIFPGNDVVQATTGDTQTISAGAFAGGIEPYTFDWGTSSLLIGEQFDFDVYYAGSWPSRQIVIPEPPASLHWHPAFSVTDAAGCWLSTGTYQMFQISPTSTDDKDLTSKLNLFPNPVNDVLYIQFPAATVLEFRMLDINGKTVNLPEVSNLEDAWMVNTEKLPAGIYFIQVETTDGYITRKFAKTD